MHTLTGAVLSSSRRLAAIAILAGALIPSAHAGDLFPGGKITLAGPTLSPPSLSFTDVYSFTLVAQSSLDYFANYTDYTPVFPIAITSFVATLYSGLSGTTGAIASGVDGTRVGGLVPNSFFLGSLAPGQSHLTVTGDAAGSGFDTYSGLLRAAAPVVAPIPEPEIWAMMLVGAGLVGMRLRRKSHIDSARHFA